MKIYTKKGDKGETSLFGGNRVSKSSPRIEAYGTVDELNSILGMVLSQTVSDEGREVLQTIQEHLFVMGADLATPPSSKTRIERIGDKEIDYLEKTIDRFEDELPELKNFILPGGNSTGSLLHFARTVCRRAERSAVRCEEEEEISTLTIKYLNRLSDLLFVAARFENRKAGVKETPWKPKKKR